MRTQLWLGWTVAVYASALSGCAKDDVSEQDYEEVANSLGALLEAEEDSAGASSGLSAGESGGLTESGNGTYTGTVTQGTGSIDYEYAITCADADGNTQDVCDASTTDSAELTVSWDGTWDGAFWDLDVTRDGHWTVEGLLPATDVATFNGTGSFDVSASGVGLFGREHTLDLEYDAMYSEIQLNKETLLFVGGRATYEVHGVRTATGPRRRANAEFDITVEVQFLGGGEAMLILDGSRHYTVELSTGQVTSAQE